MLFIVTILMKLIQVVEIVVIIRIILSWVVPIFGLNNGFVYFIFRITDPLLKPFRVILPIGKMGGIDFSPVLLFFVLQIVQTILMKLLYL